MKLTVIGIGNMGRAIASALIQSGDSVTVFNRTASKAESLKAKGARVAATAAEAIEASECTVLVLLDGASTRRVLESPGVLEAVRGKAIVNAGEMPAEEAIGLSALITAHGGRFSDVGVIAYPAHVEQRTAQYVATFHADDAAMGRQIFSKIGSAVHEVGTMGDAHKVMRALALTHIYQTIAIGSAVAAFERQGLPIAIAQAVLSTSSALGIAGSGYVVSAMKSRHYGNDQWTVDNMVLVCDELIECSKRLSIDWSVVEAVRALYAKTSERGHGARDVTALYEAICPRG